MRACVCVCVFGQKGAELQEPSSVTHHHRNPDSIFVSSLAALQSLQCPLHWSLALSGRVQVWELENLGVRSREGVVWECVVCTHTYV